MPFRNKQYQVTANGFFFDCCIYTADGCSTKSLTAVLQCQIVYKSVSATVHLIPLELHCATLHPMSTPGAWRPRGLNDGVKHGRLRRLCPKLHQTWCYYVTIAVLKPAAARHRRLDSVVRCAAQFKHRVVDRSWPPRCRIKPKPNMITFTRKKQAPQVMLDCKSHTQVTSGPPTYSTVLHTGVRATKVAPFPSCLHYRMSTCRVAIPSSIQPQKWQPECQQLSLHHQQDKSTLDQINCCTFPSYQ